MNPQYAAFEGFPKEGLDFLQKLEVHNNREWFGEHKRDYERFVKIPSQLLLKEIASGLEGIMGCPFQGKLFRIYRDLRFSKDKTPYHCHVRISFFPTEGDHPGCGKQAFHLSIETDRVIAGAGCFDFSKEALNRYREALQDPTLAKNLVEILQGLQIQKSFRLEEPKLKRVPRGFDPDHPMAYFLRQKGLLVWHDHQWNTIAGSSLTTRFVLQQFRDLMPVNIWLSNLYKG